MIDAEDLAQRIMALGWGLTGRQAAHIAAMQTTGGNDYAGAMADLDAIVAAYRKRMPDDEWLNLNYPLTGGASTGNTEDPLARIKELETEVDRLNTYGANILGKAITALEECKALRAKYGAHHE